MRVSLAQRIIGGQMKHLLLSLIALGLSAPGWARGLSAYPLGVQQRYVSVEFAGTLSAGTGVGLQARYSQKLGSELTMDAGFGFSDGDRAHRIFAGADYEFYPDYQQQPRISLQGHLERSREFAQIHTKFGVAPMISKGLLFWGQEGFPYVRLPITLDLNSGAQSYEVGYQLALGASLPLSVKKGRSKLLASFEVSLDLNQAYSGILFGLSHPLN